MKQSKQTQDREIVIILTADSLLKKKDAVQFFVIILIIRVVPSHDSNGIARFAQCPHMQDNPITIVVEERRHKHRPVCSWLAAAGILVPS